MIALLLFNLRARYLEWLTGYYRREVPRPVLVWVDEAWRMKRLSSVLLALGAGILAGCGAAPMAPTGQTRLPFAQPIALTGQSNAVILEPYLQALTPVIGAWENGRSITNWGPRDWLWQQLAAALATPVRALVYMQGESDCDGLATADPTYADDFADLMTRVRAVQPDVFVLVVTVSPLPTCDRVRAIQAAWVAAQGPRAALLSADDIPRRDWPSDLHLTEAGAAVLAARVYDALAR